MTDIIVEYICIFRLTIATQNKHLHYIYKQITLQRPKVITILSACYLEALKKEIVDHFLLIYKRIEHIETRSVIEILFIVSL